MDKLQPIGGNLEIFVSKEHRYGTDAVMLSYFSKVKSKDKVCELGTGCGIISLLLSREQKPQILAVDIQQNAIDLVQKSIEYNKLNNITPLCADLKTLKGKQDFDVVIMNPPYKKANAGQAVKIFGQTLYVSAPRKNDRLNLCYAGQKN